ARLLAFGSPSHGEAGALRLRPCLGLCLLAEREDDPVELRRIEPREHVRLVLLRIGRAGEQPAVAVLDDPRIVTGRERVGACAPPTAAASSSVNPTSGRSRPRASASTMRSPSSVSRTSAKSAPRAESPSSWITESR